MSLGTTVYTMRIPDTLINEMRAVMAKRDANSPEEPWTQTAFILTAIKEKISKMERSRKSRKKGGKSAGDQQPGPGDVPGIGQERGGAGVSASASDQEGAVPPMV